MANVQLKVHRVLALPTPLVANSLYFVKALDGLMEVVLVGTDIASPQKVIDKAVIEALIQAAVPDSAPKLTTARLISMTGDGTFEVSFDGSENVSGALTLAATISSDTTGNAATATKLAAPFKINGVDVDGSADVTISAEDTATPRIAASEKGAAGGVATLDSNGFVPSSQLPSYVDDVIEVDDFAALPATGESGKIYVTKDEGKAYRWTGTQYLKVMDAVSTADVAVRLAEARTISLSGAATASGTFDGSGDLNLNVTLAAVTTAGEKGAVVTTNAAGQVTGSRNLEASDVALAGTLDNDISGNAATATVANTLLIENPEW